MIFISEEAKKQVKQLKQEAGIGEDYFIRVSVVGGGCSGLSYKMDFDDESKPTDQVFEDKNEKLVTDLRSFLYVCGTTLEFSRGLDGKGFYF
ncbi:MAG: HesB/IscA family protein, partial [Chitinophagales bacterium]